MTHFRSFCAHGQTSAAHMHEGEDIEVVFVESSERVDVHAWTMKEPSTGEQCDMGFMVMNSVTY